MKIKNVEWSNRAVASLDFYCARIARDSPTSASKVRREIVNSVGNLSKNPTLYQIDEYYPDNKGDIRRFFRWSFRIVYQVRETKVVVLNIFHTGMDPDM
ncbi:type II toxin-antitoxin system RelE/ParE family toxin, partial [Aquiflexum sp.]|uniref:type II toxin-antitoxin system RelE/ParE family toxin n=1 Tax=Aquiflexum sp. TaxID=1872584 RepID=UPI003592F18F